MKSLVKTPLLTFIILTPIFFLNWKFQDSIIQKGLKLDSNTKTLILGDSHGACSFNPQFIDGSRNFSNWGESLLFTYLKLDQIIKSNLKQERLNVVVNLSYHSLYPCRENFLIAEQRDKIIREYYPLLNDSAKSLIGIEGTSFYLSKLKYDFGIPFQFKTNLEKFINKESFFTVGFSNNDKQSKVTPEHALEKFKDHFNQNPQLIQSEILLKYLTKIIQLCKEYQLNLILINTPKHKYYRDIVPHEIKSDYYNTINTLLDQYNELSFFDLSETVNDPRLFKDTDHLNNSGSIIFSKKINILLEK